MPAISVLICTRKPREDHLNRTLKALREQTLPKDQWELLVVSVAADGPLSGRFDLSWHPQGRFILEEQTSKGYSVVHGIAEARGDLIILVDDDNVLRADYLENALKIGAEHPRLGAWGGSQIPEFEVEPPAELRPWLWGLMIQKRTTEVWAKWPRGNDALPAGAGMVVRKEQAAYYREQVLKDPIRLSLGPPKTGAEDSDLALCSFQLNLGTGMFPQLELTHLIPARKLTLKYLEHLYEAFGYGGVVIEAVHDPEAQHEGKHSGQLRPSPLKSFLMYLVMVARGRSRVDRRLTLARERGKIRALRDLQQAGYFDRPSPTKK